MRFNENNKTEKIVIEFLLFPKKIGGETRWLEFAKIKYKYLQWNGWTAVEWLN